MSISSISAPPIPQAAEAARGAPPPKAGKERDEGSKDAATPSGGKTLDVKA